MSVQERETSRVQGEGAKRSSRFCENRIFLYVFFQRVSAFLPMVVLLNTVLVIEKKTSTCVGSPGTTIRLRSA